MFFVPYCCVLFSFSVGAKSFDGIDTNNFCDPPLIFSASICSGESITRGIQAPDPAYTYNWYADAAHSILLATGTSFTTPVLFSTTNYYVVGVSGGCTAEKIITISVNTVIPPIVNDFFICKNEQHDSGQPFVENPQPGYTYNWYETQTGTTILHTGITYTTPELTHLTIYWVEAVNGNCKSIRTQDTVWLGELPAFAVEGGGSVCEGSSAILNIQAPVAMFTYQWSSSSTGPGAIGLGSNFTTPQLFSTTTFHVNAVYNECRSLALNVVINIINEPPPVVNDAIVCPGDAATLSVQNPQANLTYNWYSSAAGGTPLATGDSYITGPVNANTNYYVGSTGGICNSGITEVLVRLPVLDSPKVTATGTGFTSVTFSWPPVLNAGGYEVSINDGPYMTPGSGNMGLTHTVSGLSQGQTASITVKAIPSTQFCGNASYGHATGSTYGVGFYVPSAFTPNGDTRNDILKPIIPFGSVLEYFAVYNRWGKLIFTANKNGIGWDGKVAGKDQPIGTYVWICRYLFAGRTEMEEKGSFILMH